MDADGPRMEDRCGSVKDTETETRVRTDERGGYSGEARATLPTAFLCQRRFFQRGPVQDLSALHLSRYCSRQLVKKPSPSRFSTAADFLRWLFGDFPAVNRPFDDGEFLIVKHDLACIPKPRGGVIRGFFEVNCLIINSATASGSRGIKHRPSG